VALATAGAGWALYQRLQGPDLYEFDSDSALIVRESAELGPGVHLLLPNLEDARVVVPARPHEPRDFQDPENRATLQRKQAFLVNTNSLSTRGPEPSRDPDDFLILCVGDSVTFGWGYEDHESYPALLADALGVEVVNAGVPALKPAKIADWIQLLKQDLQVDLVLFSTRPDRTDPEKWEDYAAAVAAAARAAHPAPLGVVLAPESSFDAQDRDLAAAQAARVAQLVAPQPVLDLAGPFQEARPPRGVILERSGTLQRLLRLPDREVLLEVDKPGGGVHPDLAALFDNDPDLAEPLFFDGSHPDREGLQLFAAQVAEWVRTQGWLPPS